jgi:unsaturated chondroitin disaccharide hydrolase
MSTLVTPEFLAIDTPGWEGILKQGSYHERRGLGVGESVMWGEYFFVEALSKVLSAPAVQ